MERALATRGAFDGVKIVEYATMVSGPYCGKLLADMGADVIKVEEPPSGDPARQRGPFPGDEPHPERSGLFLYLNTSKRGITLNLDRPDGLEAFRRLVAWADVLIDNHPPEGLESLGLGWDELRRQNPSLILASLTPYGRTGPRARAKGGELTSFHAGGLGNLLPTRSEDMSRPPIKAGGYPTGYSTGLTAAVAIAGALYGRRASGGGGRLIDVSEQEAILALVRTNVASTIYHRTAWSRVPERPPALGRLECKDGYVVALLIEDRHWRAFVDLMGNPEWASGPEWGTLFYRAGHLMEIADHIAEWAAQQSKEDVHHRGAAKGFAIGSVYSAEEVMNYRQHLARDYFVEVDHPEAGKARYAGWPYKMRASPPAVQRPAPLLGQHNREVLEDVLGFSADEFADLCRKGAAWKAGGQ
jgi:crotonobetainyl-CoA:carnitine CoA-transferase CaiB-like acyl-CoA transferase